MDNIKMKGVRDYGEGFDVELWKRDEDGRLVVISYNEGGCNFTTIDLLDIIEWVRENKPELLE
jgi:hypothetical protein